jgi:hypothetical protein
VYPSSTWVWDWADDAPAMENTTHIAVTQINVFMVPPASFDNLFLKQLDDPFRDLGRFRNFCPDITPEGKIHSTPIPVQAIS